jgi:hypothetical protein
MRNLICILLTLLLFSCSPQKVLNRKIQRAEKYAKKHDLTTVDTIVVRDTIRDTISFTTELVRLDTVFTLNEIHDTVTITKDNLTIRYYHDTIHDKVFIQGECDTIWVEIPYERIVEFKVPCETANVRKSVGWWYWLIIILLALGLLYSIKKR